jgi:hypothetical protein
MHQSRWIAHAGLRTRAERRGGCSSRPRDPRRPRATFACARLLARLEVVECGVVEHELPVDLDHGPVVRFVRRPLAQRLAHALHPLPPAPAPAPLRLLRLGAPVHARTRARAHAEEGARTQKQARARKSRRAHAKAGARATRIPRSARAAPTPLSTRAQARMRAPPAAAAAFADAESRGVRRGTSSSE